MSTAMRLTVALLAALVAAAAAAEEVQPGPGGTLILSMGGNWRAFYVLKGPFVKDGNELAQRGGEVETLPPPEGWRESDFDDGAWQRLRGTPCQPHIYGGACAQANAGFENLDGSSAFQSLICLRGRFEVTDPKAAKDLALSIDYRGGVVVSLNGKEIARGNMPAGKIDAGTLAEDYPAEIFLEAPGKLLKMDWREKDAEVIRKWRLITRKLADVKVPAGLLRKGVNVLAVEVHRSAYPKAFEDEIKKAANYAAVPHVRSTCGITELVLKSPGGRAVLPNVLRPEGLRVWNSTPLVTDPYDFGDPIEPLRPVVIPACRNGAFTGMVTVGSRTPIKKLQAAMSDLVEAKTKAVIPASSALVRFGWRETPPAEAPAVAQNESYRWKYAETPVELPGAAVPVTVTVRVPRDAKPGDYAGTLTVAAEGGGPFPVPVRLSVSSFALPDPKDFNTVVDLIQSPDTLAIQYGVEPWSEAHWKLIDNSFRVLGTAGLDTVYIPMMAETHFGNEQSMVRWVKKPGGGYDHDFSILEKYLDTFEKHCGKPRIVCLYVWDISLEGGSDWINRTMGLMTDEVMKAREEEAKLKLGPQVTGFDPAAGKAERVQLPQCSDAGSLALWRPVYEKLRATLKKRGIEERAMLGILLDPKPTKEVVDLFGQLMPGTPWMVQDHLYVRDEKIHGAPVAYQANVFLSEFAQTDVRKSKFGAKYNELRLEFPRDLTPSKTPHNFRLLAERERLSGLDGFGRLGGDLWPAMKDKRGRLLQIIGRYPKNNAGGLSVWTWTLEAGPEGACAGAPFEMLREGLQETEARVFVERALVDGKVTGELAERCRAMLTARNAATVIGICGKINDPHDKQWWEHTETYGFPGIARSGYLWYLASGPEAREKELFDLAAEVAAKLGVK